MDNPVFIVALVIGSLILLSVCFVYIKHQVIKLSGLSFASIGMVLIGMSVWQTIDITIDKNGLSAKLDQVMKEIQVTKQDIKTTNRKIDATKQALNIAKNDIRIVDLEAKAAKSLASKTVTASLALKNSVELLKAQQVLKDKNIYTGTLNGELNTGTRNAIKSFQATRGLNRTGTIDTKTLRALNLQPVKNFPSFK